MCLRCRHEGPVNCDQVCRLCTIEVRLLPDPQWSRAALGQASGSPRPLQLPLQLPKIFPPKATAFRDTEVPSGWEPAPVCNEVRGRSTGTGQDDPYICTPQLPGQLPFIWRQPRTFTREHAHRIAGRDFPEKVRVREAAERIRAREARTTDWRSGVLLLVRLALAAREPGEVLVDERTVAELPRPRGAVAAVLREAGLLRPRLGSGLAQAGYQQDLRNKVSCAHCLAWAGDAKRLCDCCREWGRDVDKPSAPCGRCGRTWPLKEGMCRFCHQVLHDHTGQGPIVEQLWFNGFAPGLRTRRPDTRVHGPGQPAALQPRDHPGRDHGWVTELQHASQPALFPAPPRDWLQRKDLKGPEPDQLGLFPQPPRDWNRARDRKPPALCPASDELIEEFKRYATDQQWTLAAYNLHVRTLRLLLAWLGLEAPIPEADVLAVARLGRSWSGRRLIGFLRERGLLLPLERLHRDQAAVERLLSGLPEGLRNEAEAWVQVMRGEGHRPSPVTEWPTIRSYAHSSFPVLQHWSDRVSSLREITRLDIKAVLSECTGERAHRRQSSLRSLFRALKRERVIFQDPAQGVCLPAVETVCRRIPSDRLTGLLDAAANPMMKAIVALIAIHALTPIDIVRRHLADLDQPGARMTVQRRYGNHTVYLDTLTQRLLSQWLHERARRWPRSTNPHLFVTQQTALDLSAPPLTKYTLWSTFDSLGATPTQLRIDRIVDEAHETADPVHLMRVFGIADSTAMKYVKAAHPEHFFKHPTQP